MIPMLLASLLASPADAASELTLKASRPVVLLVDGEPATLTSNLRMRATDLEPGPHHVRITSIFGKTLYDAPIDVPADTLLEAEWVGGDLRIVESSLLGDEDALAETVAEPPLAVPVEAPVVVDEPVIVEEAVVVEVPEPVAVDAPVVVEAPVVVDQPLLAEIAVVEPAAIEDVAPAPTGRRFRLALDEGAWVEVVHGDAVLLLEVRDGALVLADGAGLVLTVD